jgi:hypothetical protein
MMVEAISMAVGAASQQGAVDFSHKSVSEAGALWHGLEFNDMDAPYFVVDDQVRLSGREWRTASIDSVISILNEHHAGLRG